MSHNPIHPVKDITETTITPKERQGLTTEEVIYFIINNSINITIIIG